MTSPKTWRSSLFSFLFFLSQCCKAYWGAEPLLGVWPGVDTTSKFDQQPAVGKMIWQQPDRLSPTESKTRWETRPKTRETWDQGGGHSNPAKVDTLKTSVDESDITVHTGHGGGVSVSRKTHRILAASASGPRLVWNKKGGIKIRHCIEAASGPNVFQLPCCFGFFNTFAERQKNEAGVFAKHQKTVYKLIVNWYHFISIQHTEVPHGSLRQLQCTWQLPLGRFSPPETPWRNTLLF